MEAVDNHASDLLANWGRNIGISTMNFSDIFCKNGICTRYLKGKWLYRNVGHLSVDGAALTIPQFSTYLKKLSVYPLPPRIRTSLG